MAKRLEEAITSLVTDAGESGIAMGTIVDTLERQGFRAQDVEMAVWEMMSDGRLMPCGFVRRVVRTRGRDGRHRRARTYELMLVPWSESQDRQLGLDFED